MTPKLPFRVGEYADEIVDATGKVVAQMFGGRWIEHAKIVVLTPDEVALRDFVIEACNSRSASTRDGELPVAYVSRASLANASIGAKIHHGSGNPAQEPASIQSGTESNSFSGSTIAELEAMVEQAVTK